MMKNDPCCCKNYDMGDHRSPLIKLDLPEYEDYRHGGTSHMIIRILRIISYVVVLALLGYSLWRIRMIETRLDANDRLTNITRMLQSSGVASFQKRTTRSIKDQMLMNSFGDEKGMMTTNAWKKPTNKSEFDELVNDLFDKIKAMHNDNDRGHFDRNMKAVFQAWFPVFDALLPKEFREDAETRKTRQAILGDDDSKSNEDSSDESVKKEERPTRSVETSSNESDTYIKPT